MRAGRMWVLLVLAAVFSMHGLQCMTADTGHAERSYTAMEDRTGTSELRLSALQSDIEKRG